MAVETGLAPSVLANLVSGHSVATELTVSHLQCVKSYESNIKLSTGEALVVGGLNCSLLGITIIL